MFPRQKKGKFIHFSLIKVISVILLKAIAVAKMRNVNLGHFAIKFQLNIVFYNIQYTDLFHLAGVFVGIPRVSYF